MTPDAYRDRTCDQNEMHGEGLCKSFGTSERTRASRLHKCIIVANWLLLLECWPADWLNAGNANLKTFIWIFQKSVKCSAEVPEGACVWETRASTLIIDACILT
jgi:hypothetical protein